MDGCENRDGRESMRHWGATGKRRARQQQRPEHALRDAVELAQEETVRLQREIELRFVRTGKLELSESRKSEQRET